MSTTVTTDEVQDPLNQGASGDSAAQGQSAESRNLLVLAVHYVVLRCAWVFKTETVIMPAFLDAISGQGWIRGCLPMLNRFGQSVPPMLFATRLRDAPYKKRVLAGTSALMAVPFLFLSATWFAFGGAIPYWMPVLFLAVYSVFFMATGLNQLTTGTVQGKLIRPDRRGRLMGVAGIVGSVVSITAAWFLLRRWLSAPDGGFGKIFAFTGCGMIAAALIALLLRETPDTPRTRHHAPTLRSHFRKSLDVFREDRNFRCVAIVAMLFISLQLLFPHFQALGRERLQLKSSGFQLMLWVIAQNAAVGLLSLLSGTVADRKGYRLAIRLQVFAAALTPLLALALAAGLVGDGRKLYWMSFCLLGLVPVTLKSLVNYTLELTEPERHPRYVATLSMCLFFPVLLAPLAGAVIDWVGFELVFVCISAVIMIGGFLTFGMAEPRHESLPEQNEATAQ